MSYRSIKKILGENSLERKCRILFGICMLILISISFYAVSRHTENQVRDNTRKIANETIATEFMRIHMEKRSARDDEADMFEDISSYLGESSHEVRAVTLDELAIRYQIHSRPEENSELSQQLKLIVDQVRPLQDSFHRAWRDPIGSLPESNQQANDPENTPLAEREQDEKAFTLSKLGEFGVDFYDVYLPGNEYVFYKPVLFKDTCATCHRLGEKKLLPESDVLVFEPFPEDIQDTASPTIYFLRYSLPIVEANATVNGNRAILLATAIITAFLSTAVLYVIMRYVIVKPLQHLRSVSDEVTLGNMAIRAHLNTGDEFEQLSRSFNRMLRYMSDAQSALRNANRDLDHKVDEQAQLNMKLYEMNKIKSEFLASMSHELRTPLNSIIGFSEVLTAVESLSVKQKGYANNVLKSGKSLLELINDILNLANLDAGKTEVNPIQFQVISTAEEVKAMIGKMADDKRIDLQLRVVDQLEPVYQDPIKIRQVITNLLSNAVKFTPEGGRVRVKIAEVDRETFSIEVDDTGVGVSEADQNIIFEKFRQGESAMGHDQLTRQHEGTGLGLSIVKELCVLLGGDVSVESVVGKGSTFLVQLPKRYQPQLAPFETTNSRAELPDIVDSALPIVEPTAESD